MNPFLSTAFFAFAFILGYRLGEKRAQGECYSAYAKLLDKSGDNLYLIQLRKDRDNALRDLEEAQEQVEILRQLKGYPGAESVADSINKEDIP